ncbi:hypothetical protein DB30_07977 [Enhygromyxa salina]|uniref:Uncharacterized protein n=1 Tax=Enhygromyxa salina TaxID=215803 RepID=A0A0C1Z7B5_9BACT|nr:hypothetical protein DB30_07977 [Enhygromyxa salina]
MFHKLSDQRHVLEVIHADGRAEQVECATRSYLVHDLLHYAVEAQAQLTRGFWGSLAGGKTLEQMNDRAGSAMSDASDEMMLIELIVGALSATVKGRSPAEIVMGLRRNADAIEGALPEWLTEGFVAKVQARMHGLMGHWKATPFGGEMELPWPELGPGQGPT